jgi:hypothetical protein
VAVDALRVAALACDPVVVGIGRRDLADVFGARASTDLGAGRRLSSDLRRSAARIGYGVYDVEPPCPDRVRAAQRRDPFQGLKVAFAAVVVDDAAESICLRPDLNIL